MARRERPTPPQPPWVWGPAEVNEWIRAAYPSGRPRTHAVRQGPETIPRIRVVVVASDAERVRSVTEEALDSIGLTLASPARGQERHRVVGSFHRSLAGERVHVTLQFDPPIHVSSCARILGKVGDEAKILRVTVHERRERLPRK